MKYKREEQFIVITYQVCAADGKVAAEETKIMLEVGVANELNLQEMENVLTNIEKYDVEEVINSTLEDYEIQNSIFNACIAVAKADGKISIEEIQTIHALGEYFEWASAFVTYNFINLFKENSNLEIVNSEVIL